MKVLVTGCYGFVGHHICCHLTKEGHKVVGTDRLGEKAVSEKAERVIRTPARMEYEDGNLVDTGFQRNLFHKHKPDMVVHCAAQWAIAHNRETMERFAQNNIVALLRLLETCREEHLKRFIFISSITARHDSKPSSLYGASKKFGEDACFVYSGLGLETVSLRLGAVYGPYMRRDSGLGRLFEAFSKGLPMKMGSGFRRKHEMVYIGDVCESVNRFLSSPLPVARNPTFLIAADDFTADYGDVVSLLGSALNLTPRYPGEFQKTVRNRKPDLSELKRIIDFVPSIGLSRGIELTLPWLRKEYNV